MSSEKGVALVVGATGYVGSHIVRQLIKQGYSVRATCRDPAKAEWLKELAAATDDKAHITLHQLTLTPQGFDPDNSPLDSLAKGCKGIFMCAGYERQEPETIDFMVNAGLGVMRAAAQNTETTCVVLTSSTGATNPPGAPPDAVKNETDFLSDPDAQKANGRYSPAAKTLMEAAAFDFVGRDRHNNVVTPGKNGNVRLCILNPSLIIGPQLQPGQVTGNGLPWFVKIVKGDTMGEEIPNDSMSIIHVEDLALLHVACMEQESASGRYFGVNRSWPWEQILTAVKNICPDYKLPPKKYSECKPVTRFDNTRRDTLGVTLKPLEEILEDTIAFLKLKGCL